MKIPAGIAGAWTMADHVTPEIVNFLIIGCQRCGTTWVDAALREHPDVYLPPQKQTYFFDRHWEQGHRWYLDNFRGAMPSHKAVGEIATGYCLPDAVARMADLLPHVRLVMIMRHPLDRAWSYYWSRKADMGWNTFHQALEEEPDIVERGLYADQVECILRHYPQEQLLLLFHDDLARDDRAFLDQILTFIGLQPGWSSSMIRQNKNAAMFPRTRHALNAIGMKPLLGFLSRSPLGTLVRRLKKPSSRGEGMSPALRRELSDTFRDANARLADIAGRNLSHWNL